MPIEAGYYGVHLYNTLDDTFVVTEGFKALWEKLKSGKCKQIAINGPKGVGKSLALAAIATLLRRDGKKCFLWTPRINNPFYRSYAQEVFGKHSLSMVF
jgi:ABC-type lipoprotein export system ATPase subunit